MQETSRKVSLASVEKCHKQYEALPPRGAKPNRRTDGRREWTILSGLLLQIRDPSRQQDDDDDEIHLIALATGVKCSPLDKISAQGDILHDSHAEILTRRAARRWFLRRLSDETQHWDKDAAEESVRGEAIHGIPRIFERIPEEVNRWRLRQNVRVLWYMSTLPCGDASTAHLHMNRSARFQSEREGTTRLDGLEAERTNLALNPHVLHPNVSQTPFRKEDTIASSEVVRGRAYATSLSTLRTKPGRPDSLPSASLSCSDKLASYVALGLQGSLLSALVEPIIPSAFIIGFVPNDQISLSTEEQGKALQQDCQRALWDRLGVCFDSEIGSDNVKPRQPPTITLMPNPGFCHSKESVECAVRAELRPHQAWDDVEPVPASGSVTWIRTERSKGNQENVVAGLKMGASPAKKKGQELLPLHASRRSTLCKLNWYREFLQVDTELRRRKDEEAGGLSAKRDSYYAAKNDSDNQYILAYRRRKLHLRGWLSGPATSDPEWVESVAQRRHRQDREWQSIKSFVGSSGWTVAELEATRLASAVKVHSAESSGDVLVREPRTEAPFFGWLVLGSRAESFDSEGMLRSTTQPSRNSSRSP
ncbi:hypothetical protein CF319_g3540 [Tilletia indica]|nr:hypothetical protein CF319_g3540 [Tilletia indica]